MRGRNYFSNMCGRFQGELAVNLEMGVSGSSLDAKLIGDGYHGAVEKNQPPQRVETL